MSTLPALLLLPVALLAALASVMSALLERGGVIRLRHWAEESGGAIEACYRHRGRFEAFRFALSLTARAGLLATLVLAYGAWASAWLALALALALVLTAELTTRVLVGRRVEEGLRRLSKAYRVALVLLAPLIFSLQPIFPGSIVPRREEALELDEASEGEIDAYISVGQREGILEPGEELLVKGVFDFGDTLVKGAMTPRIDMISASISTQPRELLQLFLDSGHSRIPLYRDSPDEIVGVLHLRDLVAALSQPEPVAVAKLGMPPFIVPETKPIAELLREFQARQQQLAVVVDEFGGTAGLVTVEDLVEEIVGDIADEHEERDPDRVRLGEKVWLLSGSFDVEELEELFAIELGDVPYETVGGLVFTELGRLPEQGERIGCHGLSFEVLDVQERRIQQLRVQPLPDLAE